MDGIRANRLTEELSGKKIAGWLIGNLIDYGKSAAVFMATKDGLESAIKVFDRELVERFGRDVQLTRISRELQLKDHGHPHVVQIYDGGHDSLTDSYFVAMECVAGQNLAKQIDSLDHADVPVMIEQLADAAKYLESKGLVHRDIKPSNIVWCPERKQLTLLDLGVLGPVGETGQITDMGGRAFIGTLQYSSPEYLLREEDDSIDGWRALTFYQIGAVLHDLIMRKPIFSEFCEPYGRLVVAVQHEVPIIQSGSTPPHLVELARRCLLKKPELRLALVGWPSFEALASERKSTAKERVTNRTMMSVAKFSDQVSIVDEAKQRHKLEAELSSFLRVSIRSIRQDNSIFPPAIIVPKLELGGVLIKFEASNRHRLPVGMEILVRCNVIDASEEVVELTGQLVQGESPYEISFFKGVVDRPAMYAGLEEFIYSMLDGAQQQQE